VSSAPPRPEIERAAAALLAGGIVCVPTETMYGLAVDIRRADALERLVELKGRDDRAPFGLIAPDAACARGLAQVWPAKAEQLVDRHWPGPLTLVVPARADLAPQLIGRSGGVGVRVSSHPWAAALARAVGGAITATSANPVGAAPALTIAAARAYFGDRVDVYLDAGPAAVPTPSTVVQVAPDGALTILRQGALALDSTG
jgi:L-threonylcarbamoyladenylate synthase